MLLTISLFQVSADHHLFKSGVVSGFTSLNQYLACTETAMASASILVKFLTDCSWLTHGNWLWLQEQLFHVVAEDRLIAARARGVANLLEGNDFALDTSSGWFCWWVFRLGCALAVMVNLQQISGVCFT